MKLFLGFPALSLKFFSRFGKNLILFPDQIHLRFRKQSSETKFAVTGSIEKFVKTDCISKPFLHQQGSIKQKVTGSSDIQFREAVFYLICWLISLQSVSCLDRIRGLSHKSSGDMVSFSARESSFCMITPQMSLTGSFNDSYFLKSSFANTSSKSILYLRALVKRQNCRWKYGN